MTERLSFGARRLARGAAQFALLTAAMFLTVVLMAVVDSAILWRLGSTYRPPTLNGVSEAGVLDFQFGGAGAWGASQICYCIGGPKSKMVRTVLQHDLRRPHQPLDANVGDLNPQALAVSPAGDWIAILDDDSHVHFWNGGNLGDGPRKLAAATGDVGVALRFSPDGRLLAVAGDRWLTVWRVPSGELVHRLDCRIGVSACLSFSPDSRQLLSAGGAGRLHLWDVVSGRKLQTITISQDDYFNAVISPDGRQVGYRSGRVVGVYDLAARLPVWEQSFGKDLTNSVAFTSDSSRLAACSDELPARHQVWVWNVRTGRLLHQHKLPNNLISGMAVTPDDAVYAWDMYGQIHGWSLETGKEIFRFSLEEWASRQMPLADDPHHMAWLNSILTLFCRTEANEQSPPTEGKPWGETT